MKQVINDDYCTPGWLREMLVDWLEIEFDAAATEENALVERFFTAKDDALNTTWPALKTFCNPPYSQRAGPIGRWLYMGYEGYMLGAPNVSFLLPANTSSEWYRKYIAKGYPIKLPRIKFEYPLGTVDPRPRHHPMLLTFCDTMRWIELLRTCPFKGMSATIMHTARFK